MHFAIPQLPSTSEPMVSLQTLHREDVIWSRPVFKAPPLESFLPDLDPSAIAEEFRRIGLGQR